MLSLSHYRFRPGPRPGGTLADIRTVDLGGTEALCMRREYARGQMIGKSQWFLEGLRIDLVGADLERLPALARLVPTEGVDRE